MNWSKITLRQYYDLTSINPTDYDDRLDFLCDFVSIATNKDIEEIESMRYDDLMTLYKSLLFVNTLPTESEVMDGYVRIPFNKIKLGEFIDLEHYLQQTESIPQICAILYKKFKVNEWGETVNEPYKYSPESRKEFFLNQPMSVVGDLLKKYIDYRTHILETYKGLFEPPNDDEENEEELTEEIKKEIEQENRFKKFAWEHLIINFANGDKTKFDEVTNMSLILVFNILSAEKNLP